MTTQLIMYTKAECPNCVQAKALLDAHGLDFEERNLDDPSWRDVFTRLYPDIRQMPQVFYRGERLGGLAGVRANLEQLKAVAGASR